MSFVIIGVPVMSHPETPDPNTVVNVGPATVILNEQIPMEGSQRGLMVNAVHVVSGADEVIVASAANGVKDCPGAE